jgi:hypothetical protein
MDGSEVTKSLPGEAPGTTVACSAAGCSAQASEGTLRFWMRDRRVLAVAGFAVTGTGLGLGWDWLTAVGVAPLIVSAAPCLIMCALGVCMMGRGRQASSNPPAMGAADTPARAGTDSSA